MATIQVRAQHLSTTAAVAECHRAHGVREISDEAAVTIAALWQSPGRTGAALAALASGAPVDTEALSLDISQTISEHYQGASAEDRLTLDMLGTWAIAKGREARG